MFCPASVKAAGHSAIPARRLLDIVRSLPDGEVRVRSLKNHWVQIGSGRSTFKLAAMAKDNFPALPDVPAALAEVPGRTLGRVIDRTAFAMSSEESRYTLNGALLVLQPGKVEMVATDGSRLSLAVREAEVAGLKSEEGTLVPRRALGAIRRLAEAQESDTPIKIARDDSHLFFSSGDSIVITRLMSGQFPNYKAVLPQSNSIVLTRKYDGSRQRGPGRLRTRDEIQRLVVRMAMENRDWGYPPGELADKIVEACWDG